MFLDVNQGNWNVSLIQQRPEPLLKKTTETYEKER